MKTSDIPTLPILQFLQRLARKEITHTYGKPGDPGGHGSFQPTTGTMHPGFPHSVINAMPSDVPRKLAVSKMQNLISRGYVDGCACGCSGAFELTARGRDEVRAS